MKKKDWNTLSQVLMGATIISVLFAAIGYINADIWLASTQWLLVAVLMAAFGLYSKMNG